MSTNNNAFHDAQINKEIDTNLRPLFLQEIDDGIQLLRHHGFPVLPTILALVRLQPPNYVDKNSLFMVLILIARDRHGYGHESQ